MSVFMLSSRDRISEWRHFRMSLYDYDLIETLNKVAEWWSKAPSCSFSIDWDQPETWPNPWELLTENAFCETAIAYMIHQTLILANVTDDMAKVVRFEKDGDALIAVLVNNEYVLNYSYGEVFKLSEVIEDGYRISHMYHHEDDIYTIQWIP